MGERSIGLYTILSITIVLGAAGYLHAKSLLKKLNAGSTAKYRLYWLYRTIAMGYFLFSVLMLIVLLTKQL